MQELEPWNNGFLSEAGTQMDEESLPKMLGRMRRKEILRDLSPSYIYQWLQFAECNQKSIDIKIYDIE